MHFINIQANISRNLYAELFFFYFLKRVAKLHLNKITVNLDLNLFYILIQITWLISASICCIYIYLIQNGGIKRDSSLVSFPVILVKINDG